MALFKKGKHSENKSSKALKEEKDSVAEIENKEDLGEAPETEKPEEKTENTSDNEKKEEAKPKKEIIIREKDVDEGDFYDSPVEISEEELLSYDPDSEEDLDGVKKRKRDDKKKHTLRNAILISLAVIVLCSALIFIFAGSSYSFKNALINIQNWFMGTDAGDGYPVSLTGSSADKMGFFSQQSDAFVLTDSSFTSMSLSGETNFSHRHSSSLPSVSYSDSKYIIYDMGSTSYIVGKGSEAGEKFVSENNINSADISKSGKYCIFTQSQDYAAELLVYNENHELVFTYKYAENYPVAAAVSPDGKKACAVTVNENGGELYSVIAVFELNKEEPVAQYVSAGNFITELHWESGSVFALGDKAAISCDSYNNFVEYVYDGNVVTAADYNGGKLFVSVSDYEYAGSSVLYIFDGSASNVRKIELSERIEDISAYGNYVSLLIKKKVYCYDLYSLSVVASGDAAYDTLSIAMANDTGVYTLGVTEVNFVHLSSEP